MLESKKRPRHQAKDSNPNKNGCHVRIFAAKDARSSQHQCLASPKTSDDVIGIDAKGQRLAFQNGLVDPSVEFKKVRLRRNTHPNNKVLIGHPLDRAYDIRISFIKILRGFVLRVKVSIALSGLWIVIRVSVLAGIARVAAC